MYLDGGFDFIENKYYLHFLSKNKYYKGFVYKPDEYGWDDRITPDTYTGMPIKSTKENLKKYIKEIEEEIKNDN
jgi:predicted DNA-binding transcriptional regulator